MQDFTGVPAVVDLASMRDAVKKSNGNPSLINPQCQTDLVIDHSVMVDHHGSEKSMELNTKLEYSRNSERYRLLKWGQKAFKNFRIVPPSNGIIHQINIEFISQVVFEKNQSLYPDTVVGTDSHTTMVNGLGVLGRRDNHNSNAGSDQSLSGSNLSVVVLPVETAVIHEHRRRGRRR